MSETVASFSNRRWMPAQPVRIGVSLAVSIVLLYFATRNLQVSDIRRSLSRADWWLVAMALASVAVNTLAKAFRWKVLLGPAGETIGFVRLLGGLIIGQMLNLLLPARLGDVSRGYTIGAYGPGRLFTLATVVLEKLLDMLAYSVLVVCVLFLIPLPAFVHRPVYLLMLSTFSIAGVGAAVAYRRPALQSGINGLRAWLPTRVYEPILASLRSVLSGLSTLGSRHDLIRLSAWTALSWATAVLNNHLTLLALGIHVPLTASMLLLVVLQAGISIASVPASIGIFEYLCIVVLALFRVDQASALSFGVLLHAVVMIPTLIAGVPLVWHFAAGTKRSASS